MRKYIEKVICGLAILLATNHIAHSLEIKSFQGNGQLSWTNSLNSNALYRVEWSSQASGPWYRTFDNIGSIDGRDKTEYSVQVPMFYRVVMITNTLPDGMVWIEGGDVELGQTGIAEPVHTNFISGFWMSEMEVTKQLWDSVYTWATNNGFTFSSVGSGKAENHPVNNINWYDCVKWCNARSVMENLVPCYYLSNDFVSVYTQGVVDIQNDWVIWDATGYRLPTEAEWEKAARGARQDRLFPWGGDTISHSQANYFANTNAYDYDVSPTQGYHPAFTNGVVPYTSPVGSFSANGFGLHDMAGNIAEWCWDWYEPYSSSYQTDPLGSETINSPIIRGGSWSHLGLGASGARCALRGLGEDRGDKHNGLGFRCVRR